MRGLEEEQVPGGLGTSTTRLSCEAAHGFPLGFAARLLGMELEVEQSAVIVGDPEIVA